MVENIMSSVIVLTVIALVVVVLCKFFARP